MGFVHLEHAVDPELTQYIPVLEPSCAVFLLGFSPFVLFGEGV